MIKQLREYIISNNLFELKDKLLVAVSGGIDSMFLLYALIQLDYKIEVIHCNFCLRGDESDKDADFIQKFSEDYNIKSHIRKFDTLRFAKEKKISIQMAARDLRYIYFEEIRLLSGCNYVAIAHNSDDDVETFFINLIRGSGIKGLSGIRNKIEKIVRPILSFSRNEISDYVTSNKIPYREDSSNLSSHYIRNNFRNNIFPLLSDINPSFKKTVLNQISIIDQFYQMNSLIIDKDLKKMKSKLTDGFKIKLFDILSKKSPKLYIYELFVYYGFKDFDSIYLAIKSGESGKFFLSDNFRLLIDREYIYLKENSFFDNHIYNIDQNSKEIDNPIKLNFLISYKINLLKTSKKAFLDFDKLTFPLRLRKWQNGDFFYPLGMKSKKKLSDFFIDQKLSLFKKDDIWLLCTNNDIVWVVGYRIDDRYKVTDNTKKMYIANLLN